MGVEYKWNIAKHFNWEMSHRVHNQRLDHKHLSLSTDCACKHLHGHSYEIKVYLGADLLDQSSMVTDFKNLNFVKEFLDNCLDHKFMIDVNDPLFCQITNIDKSLFEDIKSLPNFTNLGEYLSILNKGPLDGLIAELYDSFVLVDFVPTSENICKYLKQYIQNRIGDVAKVTAVELWETKKSFCRYVD